MNSGPGVSDGFDLALTEMFNGKDHYFVIEAGSRAGKKILEKIPHRPAKPEELEQAEKAVERAASKMGRSLDMKGLKEILHNNFDSHYWGEIAKRCLTCGNCTMVCPTCFCCNIEDTTNLGGDRAERRRYWDTCYSVDFSYTGRTSSGHPAVSVAVVVLHGVRSVSILPRKPAQSVKKRKLLLFYKRI